MHRPFREHQTGDSDLHRVRFSAQSRVSTKEQQARWWWRCPRKEDCTAQPDSARECAILARAWAASTFKGVTGGLFVGIHVLDLHGHTAADFLLRGLCLNFLHHPDEA